MPVLIELTCTDGTKIVINAGRIYDIQRRGDITLVDYDLNAAQVTETPDEIRRLIHREIRKIGSEWRLIP